MPSQLAAVLARGLASADARAHLRNALRASPYTGHRLDLSTFIASRAGHVLLDAAARESGVPRAQIEAWMAVLPPSDIAVPFREHRLAWTGGEDVRVAVVAYEDEATVTLPVYSHEGDAQLLSRADGVPAYALVVIAPAEHKLVRTGRSSTAHGRTIQDLGEVEAAGEFTLYSPDGTSVTYPVTLAVDDGACMESVTKILSIQGCSVGGGEFEVPPPSPDTTILSSFEMHGGQEPFWDSEMELRFLMQHYTYTLPGNERQLVGQGVLRFTGIRANRVYNVERIAMFSRLRETGRDGITYWIDEDDVFFDDWVGWAECRQLDGCQANNIPVKVYWKSDDCSSNSANYNVGCTYRHTATVTSRWTPKF